jgi:hypothetical protein
LEGRDFTRVFFFKFCDIKNWHFRKNRKLVKFTLGKKTPKKSPKFFKKEKTFLKKPIDFTFA